jgi:hypothetical protein
MDPEPSSEMEVEANARPIAPIAQNDAACTFFVRCGQAERIEDAMLSRVQRDMERSLAVDRGAKGSRARKNRALAGFEATSRATGIYL